VDGPFGVAARRLHEPGRADAARGDATGEALAATVLLLVADFAPSLLAPLTGTLSDRFDLRCRMVGCDLAQAVVTGVIALTLRALPVLIVLVAGRAVIGQVFVPASRAAVPTLVADRELKPANAGIGFGANAAEVAGPLLAAALFTVLDVRGVLLVDAATFLISAAVLTALSRLPRREGAGAHFAPGGCACPAGTGALGSDDAGNRAGILRRGRVQRGRRRRTRLPGRRSR
jgi:MFS family permease